MRGNSQARFLGGLGLATAPGYPVLRDYTEMTGVIERNSSIKSESKNQLVRGLTLTHSTSIVICFVIGTGIFLKTAVMAQYVGSPILVLAAWVAAGLLSLAGALVYAELGAMIPKAGGDYVYLRAAYGDIISFFRG